MNKRLTAIEEVNDMIELLVTEIKKVLDDQIVGMYLHGSLALGDFNPNSSDIDFFVVTDSMLSRDIVDSLEKMHNRINTCNNKWVDYLDVSYVPKGLLNSKEPPVEPRPYVSGRNFYLAEYGNEWILERFVIREYGIVIYGPSPETLICPISSTELQDASLEILNEWWAPMLVNTSRLQDSTYQVYGILTMCRILYMFKHGTLVSKKAAAEWGQSTLNQRWGVLIRKALEWEKGASFDNIDNTIEFLRFTLGYVNNSTKPL